MNHDHEQEKRLRPENFEDSECELCGENYVGSTFDTCPHCNDELEIECEAFPTEGDI